MNSHSLTASELNALGIQLLAKSAAADADGNTEAANAFLAAARELAAARRKSYHLHISRSAKSTTSTR